MCNQCNSCCCDNDEAGFTYSGYEHTNVIIFRDDYSDICDICDVFSDNMSHYNSMDEENNMNYCSVCNMNEGFNFPNVTDNCKICRITENNLSNGHKLRDSSNNIQYCSIESIPNITKNKSGYNWGWNFKRSNKNKPFKFCKKEVSCLSRDNKSNICVLPLPQGSKNLEVIAKRVKHKSKGINEFEKSYRSNNNNKTPKVKISIPK